MCARRSVVAVPRPRTWSICKLRHPDQQLQCGMWVFERAAIGARPRGMAQRRRCRSRHSSYYAQAAARGLPIAGLAQCSQEARESSG